jgi:hydroxymethylpyrimidine pyrophosphatase-like HAD family hydrolase
MTVKLLAFDLDGTLLDAKGRIKDEDKQAIAEARAAGLHVLLVTGRSWRGTKPIYDELQLTGPAICYLGALVVADGTGRVTYHRPLAPGAWERLRAFALERGLSMAACHAVEAAVAAGALPAQDLVAADTAYATCRADDFGDWEGWNPYTELNPDLSRCRSTPIMAAVYGDRAVREALAAFPGGLPESQFDLHDKVAGEHVLHVWHESVDKGVALAAFCREQGIASDEVAAFGDMPMDASMLNVAGVGVAVPGAHPQLLAVADWVLTPAAAIRRILKG